MTTSGGGTFNAIAYVAILLAVLGTVARMAGGVEALLQRPRPGALLLWVLVAVPSLLQFPFPVLLRTMSRQPDRIRGDGQLWRLITSALVQDGGVFGTVFNLAVLYLVACPAVLVWGPARTFALFVGGAVGFDVVATYTFPSAGAGNSGATFFLDTSVIALLAVRRWSVRVAAAVAVVLVLATALVIAGDAHGLAFLGGLVAGAALAAAGPARSVPIPGTG